MLTRYITFDWVMSSVPVVVTCEAPTHALSTFSGTLTSVSLYQAPGDKDLLVSEVCGQPKLVSDLSSGWSRSGGRRVRLPADSEIELHAYTPEESRNTPSEFWNHPTYSHIPFERHIQHSGFPSPPLHPNHDENHIEILSGEYHLDLGQFLLRGTSLVNTSWVYGLVVYVSLDTRIFQNASTKVRTLGRGWGTRVCEKEGSSCYVLISLQARFKWSHLERTYNSHVLSLVVGEFIFCAAICIAATFMSW